MRTAQLLLVSAIFTSPSLLAIDGQVLINQSMLIAAGGTYTISQPGSYKLSGNLTVANINTSAIAIAANNVTIDLNGFSISGPVNCAGGFLCGGAVSGTGHGIVAGADSPQQSYYNITIRNGTIQGMGADAIHIIGDSVILQDLHIRSNLLSGILVRSTGVNLQNNLLIQRCSIQYNGSYGIKTYGGLIADNVIGWSGNSGISVQPGGIGGTVARNVVTGSVDFGLSLYSGVSYYGNTLGSNGLGSVSGGVNLGQNLCNAMVCP